MSLTTNVYRTSDLIRFVTGFSVGDDGLINLNQLSERGTFTSEFYDPTYNVTMVSLEFLRLIRIKVIREVPRPIDKNSIVHQIQETDLRSRFPHIFVLAQAVVLEGASILLFQEYDKEILRYINNTHIRIIRNNINYLCDFCGGHPEYYSLIPLLRETDKGFGYLQNQLPVLMEAR